VKTSPGFRRQRTLTSDILNWVVDADGAAQKSLLDRAYWQTARPATSALKGRSRAADPFLTARSGTVTPSVRNILPLGDPTSQVEWVGISLCVLDPPRPQTARLLAPSPYARVFSKSPESCRSGTPSLPHARFTRCPRTTAGRFAIAAVQRCTCL